MDGNQFRRSTAAIMGARIDALSWNDAIARLERWGAARESKYVCICNVHSVVTASQDPGFMKAVNEADLATPDGMPVAWMLRRLGHPDQQRINGPDLMLKYLSRAEATGQTVSFYGSTDQTLAKLKEKLRVLFPKLRLGALISPPYRALTEAEDQAYVDEINSSETAVLFVGLGCPKQELWMAQHRGRINAAMVGVGAAFDYHAGTIQRAPLWMQTHGLEWLHRLCSEPRRLWKRYLLTNCAFIVGIARQLISGKAQ